MHIEDLKRWHWVVISLVVGLLMSSVYASFASEGGGIDGRTVGPQDFLRRLGQTTKDAKGNDLPIFRNVRVYPPLEKKQVVTMEELVINIDRQTRARTGEYQQRQMVAEIPFVLNRRSPPQDLNYSIVDELAARQKRNAKIEYTYVAWAGKAWVYAICTGGSFLLIGVIWPTVLAFLQGAGFGPAAKPRSDDRWDLSKSPSSKPSPVKATVRGPTQQDIEQLAEVTGQYERSVGSMHIAPARAPAGGAASVASASQPERKWETGPVETVQIAETPKEEHEYGGEFYPVDRGAKKKE
ncbi:MAG TPA: hypothetical protein PLD59_09975 [Tepidisphaeraceae bacterium]|nr:hypothetical protein [Tepidisphaeraceae bacterium]